MRASYLQNTINPTHAPGLRVVELLLLRSNIVAIFTLIYLAASPVCPHSVWHSGVFSGVDGARRARAARGGRWQMANRAARAQIHTNTRTRVVLRECVCMLNMLCVCTLCGTRTLHFYYFERASEHAFLPRALFTPTAARLCARHVRFICAHAPLRCESAATLRTQNRQTQRHAREKGACK